MPENTSLARAYVRGCMRGFNNGREHPKYHTQCERTEYMRGYADGVLARESGVGISRTIVP